MSGFNIAPISPSALSNTDIFSANQSLKPMNRFLAITMKEEEEEYGQLFEQQLYDETWGSLEEEQMSYEKYFGSGYINAMRERAIKYQQDVKDNQERVDSYNEQAENLALSKNSSYGLTGVPNQANIANGGGTSEPWISHPRRDQGIIGESSMKNLAVRIRENELAIGQSIAKIGASIITPTSMVISFKSLITGEDFYTNNTLSDEEKAKYIIDIGMDLLPLSFEESLMWDIPTSIEYPDKGKGK